VDRIADEIHGPELRWDLRVGQHGPVCDLGPAVLERLLVHGSSLSESGFEENAGPAPAATQYPRRRLPVRLRHFLP